jgi:hypothetical protein
MEGISHLTFICLDLEEMARVLVDGLGACEVYDSRAEHFSLSREKFFLLGGVWIAVMEGGPPLERSYQHVAFAVSAADLPRYRANLKPSEWRSARLVRGSKAKGSRCTSMILITTCSSCTVAAWSGVWPATPARALTIRPSRRRLAARLSAGVGPLGRRNRNVG